MSIPRVFDRQTYARRRARAYGRESFLASEVAESLAMRIGAVNRRFQRALDLASRKGAFRLLESRAENWTRTGLNEDCGSEIVVDEEALPFSPHSFDLAVSVLSLHAVNDLPGALVQIRQSLKPDGLFLAALFGGVTLCELRSAFASAESEIRGGLSPRVAPFADVRELGGLLQRAGFAMPVADSEKTVVCYRDFETLHRDLQALGETNALTGRAQALMRRDVLAAALAHYRENHADQEGRFVATFEVIYLTAWSPHESQQKPLRPGTATFSLADALDAIEQSSGRRTAGDSNDGHPRAI